MLVFGFFSLFALLPLILLLAGVLSYTDWSLSPKKREELYIPYMKERWEFLRVKLEKNFNHKSALYKEYAQSSRIEKLLWSPPDCTYYHSRNILKNHDTPFEIKAGSWMLKNSVSESLQKAILPKNGYNGIVEYVQIIASYDAKYMMLTNDNKFYQNAFAEEKYKNIYDTAFMDIVSQKVKEEVRKDLETKTMNKKLLKNPITQKVYQETYVQEKSVRDEFKNSVKDNYTALLSLQKENSLNTEDFIKAFGDEVKGFQGNTTNSILRTR